MIKSSHAENYVKISLLITSYVADISHKNILQMRFTGLFLPHQPDIMRYDIAGGYTL